MKKILLSLITITGVSVCSFAQTTHNVNISGFTYSPSTLTINVDDKVAFAVSGSHPLVEVDKSVWDISETTAKSGGFSCTSNCEIPFSTPGDYYYVCGNHGPFGMKGMVTVVDPTGIKTESAFSNGMKVFPNPASSLVTIEMAQSNLVQSISIVSAQGTIVATYPINSVVTTQNINVSALESGFYQVVISLSDKKIYNKVMIQ